MKRVLVVVTRRIGDVLLATPVIESLKNEWPKAEIDVLVFEGTQGFLTGNPHVHRVLTVRERPSLLEQIRFGASILRRYELALSLLPGDRPTVYAWLAGRRSAGLLEDSSKSRWKRSLLDTWVPFDNTDTHTVRMYLALLEAVGVRASAKVLPAWTRDDERLVEHLLAPLAGAPYAVIHAYPKFRYKMWTYEGWSEVAAALRTRGLAIVLTGSPAADEKDYVGRLGRLVPDALDLSGALSLGATALVLSRAAVYVGPDTAITHAAAALGIPTVAIYGPTNPVKWGPWPARQPVEANPWTRIGSQSAGNVRLVQGSGACVPCGLEGCDRHVLSASACLTGLPSERVIAAVSDLLDA